jgi:hypothetical protein
MNKNIEVVDTLLCLSIAATRIVFCDVIVPCIAIVLTVAGWAPSVQEARSLVATEPMRTEAEAVPALTSLPVRELRQLARAAGHRALARNGRRADLLAVLA